MTTGDSRFMGVRNEDELKERGYGWVAKDNQLEEDWPHDHLTIHANDPVANATEDTEHVELRLVTW